MHGKLAEELKSLRKGRGVLVDRIDERVGPSLRVVCGVLRSDSAAEIREKIASKLRASIQSLPADLRLPVLSAFALDEQFQQPFHQDRIDLAAAMLKRDPRTIRRRIDEGITHLAEIIVRDARVKEVADDVGSGWYTLELNTLVNVGLPTPEVIESRTVVAEQDGLSTLDLALTVTAPPGSGPPPLDVDLFAGGNLSCTRREASDRLGFELVLPKPLMRGDVHEFTMRFRVRDGGLMRPHYVCVPRYRCDHYQLLVKFDPHHLPAAVCRLDSAFQRDLEDPLAAGEPVTVDSAGEVRGEFRRLARGLAYGFRWREAKM